MKCSICKTVFPDDVGRCPGCGSWVPVKGEGDEQEGKGIYSFSKIGNLPPIERYKTNLIDESVGGGLVFGCTYALAGVPGVGKSTLLIPLLCGIARGLYVSIEEHPTMLVHRANRLKLSLDKVDVCYKLDNVEVLDSITQYLEKSKEKTLVVIDSVSSLYGQDWVGAADFITEIRNIVRQHRHSIALCVIHANKNEDMAGLQQAQHDTDCNLLFTVKGDIRTLEATKNRIGPAFVKTIFRMTKCGLEKLNN
jgi:DNA repair protein RadA/Sms